MHDCMGVCLILWMGTVWKNIHLTVPQLSTHLQMLIYIWGVSPEAALCSSGRLLDHVFCDRWEQQPVHAVKAEGQPQGRQETTGWTLKTYCRFVGFSPARWTSFEITSCHRGALILKYILKNYKLKFFSTFKNNSNNVDFPLTALNNTEFTNVLFFTYKHLKWF